MGSVQGEKMERGINMKKSVKLFIIVLLLQGVYPIQTVWGAATDESTTPTVGAYVESDPSLSERDATSNRAEPIDSWMPDKNLQNYIAQALNLSDPNQITKDLLASSEIDFEASSTANPYYSIRNFEGLQYSSGVQISGYTSLLFADNNYLSNSALVSKTSLVVDGDLTTLFPNGLDAAFTSQFKSISIDPHNVYNRNLTINLNETNYKNFFISYEDLGLTDFRTGIDYSNLYISMPTDTLSYTGIPVMDGITFTMTNTNVDYDNLAGQHFENTSEATHFPDGPYIQTNLSSGSVSGIINHILTVNFKPYGVAGGDVTVKYQDTEGNQIVPDETKSGDIGEAYTTEQKVIDGYTFKEVQGSPNGVFSDQPQTVTYVYSKNPVKGADVKVNYVDTAGNQIADVSNETLSGNIGETYTTEQKAIKGYTFKEVRGNAKGVFTSEPQTVTYIYTKNPVIPVAGGDVTVKYQDKEGTKLAPDATKSGNVGETYTTEQQAIDGYTFKEIQGNAKGSFTSEPQTVTYIYTKNTPTPVKPDQAQKVTVNYVDDSGKAVADAILLSGKINEAYTSEAKKIEGYTLIKTPENEKGFFTDKEQTVTYVYKKNSAAPTNNHGNSQQKTTTFYTGVSRGGETYTGKSYPKTGDQANVSYVLIGAVMTVSVCIYGYLRKKRVN
jgi:LPXTG-motif cell wall-anchored protein